MNPNTIDCRPLAEGMLDYIRDSKCTGGLAVITIGHDAASEIYVRGKERDCLKVGFTFEHYRFDFNEQWTNTRTEIVKLINDLNDDDSITGIIIQLPVPEGAKNDIPFLLSCISPDKDVDGLGPSKHHTPCTPMGIMRFLSYQWAGKFEGKVVAVVGRGKLVGKPLRTMLDNAGCTVISCNHYTRIDDIYLLSHECDAMVFATGLKQHFDHRFIHTHTLCIDCGCFRESQGRYVGEIDISKTSGKNVTAVPGGVGPLTRSSLMMACARGGVISV